MRRCATLFAPARRRPTIFGANASSCFRSCCGTAGFTAAGAIGRWRIGAGLPSRTSSIPRSRSSFRRPSTPSKTRSAPAPAGAATRPHRAGVVHGAGRRGLPGDARRLVSRRRDLCRRDRRRTPVRHAAAADVLPRPRPGGKLDRRYGAAQGPHPSGQPPRPPGAGRGGLDLSLSRQGQRHPASPARRAAQSPCATSPGRRRSVCAPAIADSAQPARSRPSSWRRSLARWPLSYGRSDGRSRPCKADAAHPAAQSRGRSQRWGTPVASYVAGPHARRPSSRPRKAPRRRHGRRYPTRG